MIKVRPDKIIIEMSVADAKSLRHYLMDSVVMDGDGDIASNPIASSAEHGVERAKKAMHVRQVLLGCLDNILCQAEENQDGWNKAIRKTL